MFGFFARLLLKGSASSSELIGFVCEKLLSGKIAKNCIHSDTASAIVKSSLSNDTMSGKLNFAELIGRVTSND